MPSVRQVPKLLIRGSTFNVTGVSLTHDQRKRVDELVYKISTHPELQKSKHQVIAKLGVTIKSDYEDRQAAEQDFNISVWKAVVDLLYHHKYSFYCGNCKANSYQSNKKRITIDRLYSTCPACGCTKIKTASKGYKVGQYVKQLPDDKVEYTSPIVAVPEEKKYTNAEEILSDKDQLRKFFGEYVWNYCRQQLRENKRKKAQRTVRSVHDRADKIVALQIKTLCDNLDISASYTEDAELVTIDFRILETPPEFSAEFIYILQLAKDNNVKLSITQSRITVYLNVMSDYISSTIMSSEQILISDESHSNGDEDSKSLISQTPASYESMSESLEYTELVQSIRDGLPDGLAKDVFDIICEVGELATKYYDKYEAVKTTSLAEFLDTTTKNVSECFLVIRMQMLAKEFVPQRFKNA